MNASVPAPAAGRVSMRVLRWSARLLGLLVSILWGAFFVEHVSEWFIRPFPNHPPLSVCLWMGVHFLMIAGYVAAWRWPVPGALVSLVAGFVFLADKAGPRFPVFFTITALPGVLFLLSAWLETRLRSQPPQLTDPS